MKRLFLVVLLLIFALPVEGRVLVIYGNPSSGDVTSETGYINTIWGKYVDACGFDYSIVSMEAFTMNGSDTVWTCETMAASGSYDYAVMLNLPEFDSGYRTDDNCKSKGLNKFGKWIGKKDVTMPLPIIVLLEGTAYVSGGSIFSDSTGVSSIAASCANTYNPYTNADGDSLELSSHCDGTQPEAYLDIINQAHVTPLSWRSDSTLASVLVPSNWWKYDKDNGHPVYIIQHASASMQASPIITTLSFHGRITSIDMATAIDLWAYATTGDSVGVGTNVNDLLNYCISNNVKLDLFVVEPNHDIYTQFTTSFSKISDNTNTFHFVPQTRRAGTPGGNDWIGYLYNNMSSAVRRSTIALAIDSIAADYYLADYVDTTGIYGYKGAYGSEDGKTVRWGQTCLTDMHYMGIRRIYHGSYNYDTHWPDDPRWIYPQSTTFYIGSDRMYLHAVNGNDFYTDIAPTDNNRAFMENNMVWFTIGIRGRGLTLLRDKHTYYAPGFTLKGAYGFENDTALNDGSTSAITWAVRAIGRQIDFYNNIAADYSSTGIVPLRTCFIKDSIYDRRGGRAFPNSHVREQ